MGWFVMNLDTIARTAWLALLIPSIALAVQLIDGSNDGDQLTGSADADEIYGRGGNDRLYAGAGDDILIGGRGTDILVGGLGSDQFVIDFLSRPPDKVYDFYPEQGDTLILTFPELSQSTRNANRFTVTRKGMLKIRLNDQQDTDVVNLYRSDLRFEMKGVGRELTLRFFTKF